MKKPLYKNKTREELTAELTKLRTTLSSQLMKARSGKNTSVYTTTRKNIARVLTELNSLKASTGAEK